MESEEEQSPPPPPCSCSCICCSATWQRSSKRKLADDDDTVARVEIKNEAAALREAVCSQQQSIEDLCVELDEERNASATAASEAMSMILRLQREKAETQMEFRQFKRFAEQKMSHDQDEIAALEDLVFKKDQLLSSLSRELQTYRQQLLGVDTPSQVTTPSAAGAGVDTDFFDYPPLRCNVVPDAEDEDEDVFVETPKDIETRITHMERMPSVHDKGVIGYSPRRPWHLRKLSVDSYGSFLVRGDDFPVPDRDDVCDRVCTVNEVSDVKDCGGNGGGVDEEEIKGLYMRLQALEADRESMRQTIMAMSTDKAQVVLLKEIAQQLCKEATPQPQKQIVKKATYSFFQCFAIMNVIKHWVTSFVFWRRSSRVKYTFGITNANSGLMLLLENSSWVRRRRCLTRTL